MSVVRYVGAGGGGQKPDEGHNCTVVGVDRDDAFRTVGACKGNVETKGLLFERSITSSNFLFMSSLCGVADTADAAGVDVRVDAGRNGTVGLSGLWKHLRYKSWYMLL